MDAQLLLSRIERTVRERITPAQYRTVAALDVGIWEVPDEANGVVGEPVRRPTEFQPFQIGATWGKPWQTVWFSFTGEIPFDEAVANGEGKFEARIDLGWALHSPGFQCEGLVRDKDGRTIKAINPMNQWVPIPQTQGTKISFTVEAAANPLLLDVVPFQKTFNGDKLTASQNPIYRLNAAEIVVHYTAVARLVTDLQLLYELLAASDSCKWTHDEWLVLNTLNHAIDVLDLSDIPSTVKRAQEVLQSILDRPTLEEAHHISAVGHAHIDSAWLWPLRETRRKVNRTIANVVRLIEDGEDLVFALPAAQHVAWLAEEDQELFTRVQKLVQQGSIVPVGGMWVEPDAVLPGGEAMARQLVEGLSFFRETFGVDCKELWLPDSFGYSAALPQLAREAGIRYFVTQKISWNQTNRFPHSTLWWEGIDGSRIYTHFPPADTYGSDVTGAQILFSAQNFREKDVANSSLLLFGYGDSGGGPTREMTARVERLKNLHGAPQVTPESPSAFFARAEKELPNPPVWVGELYLERHRGTNTSQILVKQANRRAEALLRETELWCTVSAMHGATYPYDELRSAWRLALLCQFHDILPGTSVAWVYREVADIYRQVTNTCEEALANAFAHLAQVANPVNYDIPLSSKLQNTPTASINTAHPNGSPKKQYYANATSFSVGKIPAFSAALNIPESEESAHKSRIYASDSQISNGLLTIEVAADGTITSLRDAQEIEYLPVEAHAGQFFVYSDFPVMWDAWDIDEFYRSSEQRIPLQLDEIAANTDHAWVRASGSFRQSKLEIEWELPQNAAYVDVHVTVDWHEHEKLLKLGFPVNIHTDKAQFETQMGFIERPTHRNTSWDEARFEVSAHRWLRLANASRAISIANDATYGWDITRHGKDRGTWSLVNATLVKSAVYPDPEQDQGTFHWNYRIRPNASVLDAVADGQLLNLPLRAAPVAVAAPCTVEGAIVESISMAPDRSGDVVLRAYEGQGGHSRVRIHFPKAESAWATDLCYQTSESAPHVKRVGKESFETELAPFQILTMRFRGKW